jgi:hypothetical protein
MPVDRNDINEQANRAAEATRNATNEAARSVRAVTNVGEHAARAGADVFQRSAETTQEAMRSGVSGASGIAQRLADQFTSALIPADGRSEELARRSSQNMEAVAQASTVIARGVQDVSREWFGLAQDRLQKNVEGFNALTRCRSVQDLIAVHSDLMRETLEQAIDTSRRVAELSVRVADEAARRMQAQANRNAERARNAA